MKTRGMRSLTLQRRIGFAVVRAEVRERACEDGHRVCVVPERAEETFRVTVHYTVGQDLRFEDAVLLLALWTKSVRLSYAIIARAEEDIPGGNHR